MIKFTEVRNILSEINNPPVVTKAKEVVFIKGLNDYFFALCHVGVFLSDVPFQFLSSRAKRIVIETYCKIYKSILDK